MINVIESCQRFSGRDKINKQLIQFKKTPFFPFLFELENLTYKTVRSKAWLS